MEFFVSDVAAWTPSARTAEEWNLWKEGTLGIQGGGESPKLEFADPLFRRRLSQISRMCVQVLHDLLERRSDLRGAKVFFSSLRGEIARQLSIDRQIIEEKAVLPAGFSLSVFNAPVASASIALGMTGGYSAAFPSQGGFASAILCAAAPVLSGAEEQVIFAYADEKIPAEYGEEGIPLAFACAFCAKEGANSRRFSTEELPSSPVEFLRAAL